MVNEGFVENRSAKPNAHPYQLLAFNPANGEFRDLTPRPSDVICLRGLVRNLLDFSNGLDQQVSIAIYNSHKRNKERPYLAKTVVVAAGGRAVETLGDPWGFYWVEVTPTVAPTAGAFLAEFEGADC